MPSDYARPSQYLRDQCPLCFGGENWLKPDELCVQINPKLFRSLIKVLAELMSLFVWMLVLLKNGASPRKRLGLLLGSILKLCLFQKMNFCGGEKAFSPFSS